MRNLSLIAIALLAAASVQAQDTQQKEPTTGKNCVNFLSSEYTATGMMQLNFSNICEKAFQVTVQATQNRTKTKTIEAGTVKKPAKLAVTCKPEDRCEGGKWQYE